MVFVGYMTLINVGFLASCGAYITKWKSFLSFVFILHSSPYRIAVTYNITPRLYKCDVSAEAFELFQIIPTYVDVFFNWNSRHISVLMSGTSGTYFQYKYAI